MLKIISIFLGIAFLEIGIYISIFHSGVLSDHILNIVVYKEYLNEYLVMSLLFIFLFKRNKIIDIFLYLLFIFVLFVDVIQFMSYYYTNNFITIDALDNLSQILLFLNKFTVMISILFIIIVINILYFLQKINIKNRGKAFIIIFIITILNFYLYNLNKHKNDIFDEYNIEKGPVLNFIKVVKTYFTPLKILNIKLSKEEKEFAIKSHLLVNPDSKYPLKKSFFLSK